MMGGNGDCRYRLPLSGAAGPAAFGRTSVKGGIGGECTVQSILNREGGRP